MTALLTSLRKAAARLPILALLLAPLLGSGAAALAADDEFLEPEKAFQFLARAADDRTLEVIYQIAPGYYLYREQFKFSAQGASLGSADVPPGKIKFDETFQKNVETHRSEVRIRLPVSQAAGPFELNVVSQGCADAGLCYPPMTSTARASLVGFGGDGQVRVQLAQPIASSSSATAALMPAAARINTGSWVDAAAVERVLKSGRFWLVIGGFFVFGLLLSLTPCVLPMLPIVSSIIAGSGSPTRGRSLLLAASYSLGMAAVYTALGIAAGLAGEGLAAALQKPWVLAAFALLLATLSLSMFDFYELRLPAAWTHAMGDTSNRLPGGRLAGVFAMGGVSALIVSPCVTAPLAGALVFIGQSRDVALGGTALFAQAAGMSVPLLLIGASAGAWLPRAGAWMVGIKRLFGLMLLAVAIWVVQPVLLNAAALALWGALLVLAGLLLRPFAKRVSASGAATRTGLLRSALGLVAIALGIGQWVGAATGANDPLQPLARLSWLKPGTATTGVTAPQFRVVRSAGELDALLRQTDRPVMLDFYADWCVSCKEMERFTFTDPAVAAMMSNALLLKADVTANNDDDKELLKRFNLFGPPGTIFFDSQGRELAGLRVIGFQDAGVFRRTLVSAGLCTREAATATC